MALYQRCIKRCINAGMYKVLRMALYQRLLAFMNVTKLEKVTLVIRRYAIGQGESLRPQARWRISANLTELQLPYRKFTLTLAK